MPLKQTRKSKVFEVKTDQFIENLTNPESPTFMNQTASYKKVNPTCNGSAQPRSSELMSLPNVQEKFLQSMKKHGLTDDNINKRHASILNNGDDSNAIKAIRIAHELKGRLGPRYQSQQSLAPIEININIGNANDPKVIVEAEHPITDNDVHDSTSEESHSQNDADVKGNVE